MKHVVKVWCDRWEEDNMIRNVDILMREVEWNQIKTIDISLNIKGVVQATLWHNALHHLFFYSEISRYFRPSNFGY